MIEIVQYHSLILGLVLLFVLGCYSLYFLKSPQNRPSRLGAVIKRHRLYKMLQYLGVDFETYLRRLPKKEIRKQVLQCKSCPNTSQCDACLRDGHAPASMEFCPNYKRLIQLSEQLSPERTTQP